MVEVVMSGPGIARGIQRAKLCSCPASNLVSVPMREVIVSATLFGTILVCLAFGVLLGYTVILGILRMFGHRPQASRPAASPALVPITHSSGD